MTQLVGYLASVLVAISITIQGGIYFRILNMTGSICFFIYGFLIRAWPVVIINVYGTGVNLFYIFKIIRENRSKKAIDTGEKMQQ
jgi:hypothetical protein